MAPSLTSGTGRGLNLSNLNNFSAQNADEEKGDQFIKPTFDILERGEKEIILDNKHRDVTLILGNTGSGKSTFTQWIAGDNTKLISKETEEGNGEYIIEDHNRIGNTTLKSKTIFPELVIDAKTNAAFYDCPGFSDTQGTSHDIAATYFIKKVLDFSESVQMVFTISHPSVRKGVDRQDFMKLMRHATDLVKDIEKFKHSIAMVATKVDNQYIKQGKHFVLVEDKKVIATIAGFLKEAKQYLEDDSRRPNLTDKENRFYENAIKFVEILLAKEGEKYPRIGIFRRPDMPGPVSDIPLLQNGKRDIERIVYEILNFTAKNNEDFGYTVSEKTKNDINEIVEEINKNLWSSLGDIAGQIQEYYGNLIEQVRDQIKLLVSDANANALDLNSSEAEVFRNKLNSGYNMTSEGVNKMKNLTNPEQLAVLINSTISNSDIHVCKDDLLYITNQGKYFNFLQTVSDKVLSSKPWYQLFQDVEIFLSSSKTVLLHEVSSAAEKINNRIQIYLNDIAKGIQEEYTEKIKYLKIQDLPKKLNRDIQVILKFTEEIKNETITGKLVRSIPYVINYLGVTLPKQNLQNAANQGKYLKFLEVIADGNLNVNTMMWLSPFENIAKYLSESEKWYTFLEDLYSKFSEFDIQRDRQRYNVANLDDWDQPGKPQGISVTPSTFEKFLSKIENFNVTEYEPIKNLSRKTDLQIEELNHVLSLTLKHRPKVMCSETYVIAKGSFISLNETMQNLISNSDTDNSCKNFETLLAAGKGISVAVIAPKWEVVGSRSIDLKGTNGAPHAKPKAKNGAHPGNDGFNGVPGNSGGSGESFFGIGYAYVDGSSLKITANGGKGGVGQNGGDGAQGVPGRNAPTPSKKDPDCENGYFRNFKCSKLKEEKINFGYVETKKTYKIYGVPGGKGGKGGDGGKGGKGADSGSITILDLSQPSEITKITSMGKEGEIGKAGAGGKGGKDGDDIIAVYTFAFLTRCFRNCLRTEWNLKETSYNGLRPTGRKGTDGLNVMGLQDPVPSYGINRPPNIINEYKIFLRENVIDRFEKYALLEFLDLLNSNDDVRKLYDPLALIDEFQDLEEQFHKLSDQMDFSLFYSSLLERISEFAKSQKDTPDSNENKKVLNYLYTAILGRLYNLKENSESNLIIDIRGYLNLIKENIKTLEDLQASNSKVDVINKYKENYKKGIDKKIDEAKYLIKKQIDPEIEKINSKIDDQLNSLIEETIRLQKQAEIDREKLAEKKKELENAVEMKGLFSFFHIIGGIVSFLGPIGAIAGTVIEATSTVVESLALNNQNQALNLPSDVVSAIASIGDEIKAMRNKKVAYLKKLLDDLSEEIKKNPEKLSDMTTKLDAIKDRLKKASEKKIEFKQVKVLESELKSELKRKADDLKNHLGDEKSIDALNVIGETIQIAQFGSLLLNMYDQMKEDNEKMDAVTDAMEKMEDKIKKLREYEEDIYDTIVPMLQEMEDQMKDINDKLGSKSQIALDVTKWQVQSTLKDMRVQMERLTEGFEVKEDLSRSIEKLEEVMTTLINIYDRIQSYQDQQNLANYIADINSVSASSINIKNQLLAKAVNHLEFAIRANLVLKQYKAAIDAFKQWVFPFADHYIEKPMHPSQLELDTNIENLVQKATREIETIRQKLDLYDVSVKNGDQYLECAEFSSRYVSSKPFFVWKNEKYGSLITSLLSGKEVFLKADIKDSVPHKDAIKFSEIDFELKLKNETSQSILYETLKGFDIRAIHLGSSYYRYANKIFVITSDSVTISYSYEKNDDGIPIRTNEVYSRLKSGDFLLSPYTLWEVRMINQTDKYSFQDLEKYKNEIYVELSGFGSYVDTNVFRPSTDKSFIGYNNTNPLPLEYTASGLNQSKRSKNRSVRSPEEIVVGGDYMTNGAPKCLSSPIDFLSTFIKTYFVTNVIASLNKIISGEQISVRKYDDCSELSDECTEARKIGSNVASPTKTDTQKIATTSAKDEGNKEIIGLKSDTIFSLDFDGNNSCSKSFLLSDQEDRSNIHLTQVPDLNCSLLLADLITRTITGNRYKAPIDECLLSPPERILGKVNDGVMQSDSDVKQMLQRLLSEKEERSCSWFCKLNRYAKSVLQLFGLLGKDDSEKYVEDVRHLFA